MFEKVKKFCDSFLERGVPGFDLAVYQNGKCILRHFNGYRDLKNKVPMDGTEKYNIYSCSKVITCTAALQLWEKGLFSLEDKLSDFMPEFAHMTVRTESGVKPAENPILIRHLFEMTAGFSYQTLTENLLRAREETGGVCQTREVMKYLAKDPLLFEPGDRWEYSLCHDVLAALVEVISGEKFEDYVKKHIFDVLGMENSTFMLPDEELDSIACQYQFVDDKTEEMSKEIFRYKFGSAYASGGAGGITTVDDYIKFAEGLRKGILLKPETVKYMMTDRLTDHQKRTYWNGTDYGYGLGVRCPKAGGVYPDFGWGGAACAYLAIDPEHDLSLYFGCHLIFSPVQGVRSMLYRMVRAELFDPDDLEKIDEDLKNLHDYHLTY